MPNPEGNLICVLLERLFCVKPGQPFAIVSWYIYKQTFEILGLTLS